MASLVPGLAGNQSIDLDSVPRKKIEAFGTAILRAKVPSLGLDLLLSPRDSRDGVVTWEAAEGITFSFRNGILVDSRGLGPDLMSSAPPSLAQVSGSGSYPRSYFFTSENDQNERRDYTCTPSVLGSETITIYGRSHGVRHVREDCLRDIGKIGNDFWLESGVVRQSRQWISPLAGYAEFSLVVN